MADKLAEWKRRKAASSREGFVTLYRQLYLHRAPRSAGDDEDEPAQEFSTQVVDPVRKSDRQTGGFVAALIKAPASPFPDRISIGRARTCDIKLLDPSVSKLHAHFSNLAGDEADLTDRKSANGTAANGRRIPAGETVRVRVGDTLSFGQLIVRLVDAAQLYDLL